MNRLTDEKMRLHRLRCDFLFVNFVLSLNGISGMAWKIEMGWLPPEIFIVILIAQPVICKKCFIFANFSNVYANVLTMFYLCQRSEYLYKHSSLGKWERRVIIDTDVLHQGNGKVIIGDLTFHCPDEERLAYETLAKRNHWDIEVEVSFAYFSSNSIFIPSTLLCYTFYDNIKIF